MTSTPKSKRQRTKSRPVATSALTQPVVQDASTLSTLTSFSSNGGLFAFLSLAIDKHRLRVYDTTSGHSVAEYLVESGRVTALEWCHFDSIDGGKLGGDGVDLPSKKKRKKRKSLVIDDPKADRHTSTVEVVVLGLSVGALVFYSPTHGRALWTLSHLTSTSAILSITVSAREDSDPLLWTSSADCVVRLWNPRNNEIMGNWKNDDRIPYSSMAVRSHSSSHSSVDILVANHAIRLLSMTSGLQVDSLEAKRAKELTSFTGHASSIMKLQWDTSQEPSTRFLSMAQGDRFVYIWAFPPIDGSLPSEGNIIASIPLDSDARSMSLSIIRPSNSTVQKQNILTLSASGKISVFPIPSELTTPATSHKAQHKVPTLLPRSNISVSSKRNSSALQVLNASFIAGEEGRVRVARLLGGARLIFDAVVS
jgi:U3 small nucleolar RNA-associated protein 5